MPDNENTQVFQVFRRQARQDLCVDFVLPERGLILAETKVQQPTTDVRDSAMHSPRAILVPAKQPVEGIGRGNDRFGSFASLVLLMEASSPA